MRIHCADPACKDFDLCVSCFSEGKVPPNSTHKPSLHSFQVVEQHSVPIFTDDWGADEEALLLEGAETYGLGSWADIADHIGGFRERDEVRDHYINTYVESETFPLPEHASPKDKRLLEEWPREKFQARKKRRIEERKETAKNAPPPPPKQKPVSSGPSCHEVQGYMPGRLEFETEHFNEAEEAVQHMQFDPGEGIDPETGELEPEMILKMTVMNIYNSRLNARVERKRLIFEQELLEYRRNTAAEKKKTREERELFLRMKPFARLMSRTDFDQFSQDMEYELNLRQAIAQLQDWRRMQVSDLKCGEKYEAEKAQRLTRLASQNPYDRLNINRPLKPIPGETNPVVSLLTGPELGMRPPGGLQTPPQTASPGSASERRDSLTNGDARTQRSANNIPHRPKFELGPIPNLTSMKFDSENTPDLHLLTPDEQELCSRLRILPKPYIAIKDAVLREASRLGGSMKKKRAREICQIDHGKSGRLFDFFVHSGWVNKA